jgi:C4-dicarboxylate-specific signal transduction histidine kinase
MPAREGGKTTLRDAFSEWLLKAYRRPLPFLLTLVVLPLLLVLIPTYLLNRTLWLEQRLHHLHTTSRLAAEIIEETLHDTLRAEQILAAQPGLAEAVRRRDAKQLGARLEETLAFLPRVDAAFVLDLEGTVLGAAPHRAELIGRMVEPGEPFRGAKHGGWQPYVSAVYLASESPARKVVAVVSPVRRDGEVVALLQCQHRVEEVKTWLQKIRIEPEGFLYVVDHTDQLVVHPFQLLPGKPKRVSEWPPVAASPLPADGAVLSYTDERTGRAWLSGVSWVEGAGWRVVAVQPERAALSILHQSLWPLAAFSLFLALVLILLMKRWAAVQAVSMALLRHNTSLLRQLQQKRTLGRKGEPDA